MPEENKDKDKKQQTQAIQAKSGSKMDNVTSTISMGGYTLLYKDRAKPNSSYGVQCHVDDGVVIFWCSDETAARELLEVLAATAPEIEERKNAYK